MLKCPSDSGLAFHNEKKFKMKIFWFNIEKEKWEPYSFESKIDNIRTLWYHHYKELLIYRLYLFYLSYYDNLV